MTNRKSYTGFWLVLRAMTLDDFVHQIRGFYGVFGDFGLQDTFQEQIAPKSIEIDKDKLRMKFLALNIDFDGPSLDILGSRKPVHKGIKEWYLRKTCYFPAVGHAFIKRFASRHGHVAYRKRGGWARPALQPTIFFSLHQVLCTAFYVYFHVFLFM